MFSGYPRVELDVSAVETVYEVKKGTCLSSGPVHILILSSKHELDGP